MTHQEENSAFRDLAHLAMEHGPHATAAAIATLMNHAMQMERELVLQAESHQRTANRQGYANGYKPRTLTTRVGQVDLRIPQTPLRKSAARWTAPLVCPAHGHRNRHRQRVLSLGF